MTDLSHPPRPTKVLSLGMPRSGSMSMLAALRILGYQDVFHGAVLWRQPEKWEFYNRTADAHFPSLPTYTGKPFDREQWDELYGPCEAITDMGSFHAEELIKTYPEAKVVVVRRPFEKWAKSFDHALLDRLYGPVPWFIATCIEPLTGGWRVRALRKLCTGYMEASTPTRDIKALRRTYDRHHETIRKVVPPERLLEMELGEGWGPLCEFLGKDVPDKDFPHVNDTAFLRNAFKNLYVSEFKQAMTTVILPWAVGIGAVVTAVWIATGKMSS